MLWSQNVHLIRFQCFRLSVDTLLEMEKMKYDVKILGKSWRGKKGSGKEGKFALRKYLGKSWSENIESNNNINRLQFDGTIHCNGSHEVTLFTNMPLKIVFELLETLYFCFRFPSPKLNFWVLSDGNITQKTNQKFCFLWVPRVLDYGLWKLSDIYHLVSCHSK